ncbi:hypothetical protein I3842_09G146100 [Carya illinoinensis]|uniref:Uncharacterized protein n=1 Tax=Carya illinoinensis TaxID=32201 RepID=A0A922E442_CARIL|nr:hypothetical protein I3842_09G146100 [Carya illinoinensis]KAG6696392.1 hypothetical protein I3842_09G146100 [Carya illinoinensis]KAG6696393.1 hypothetical protein I3842_09G146100 [Carya illinoinensis]KAG6696394.1 hypothetical protein I3842_09G146100 [Carya illinoinensis]KAG6696395.1 hypothetical protein I3842_09G146100 [Carya illinoinensis]
MESSIHVLGITIPRTRTFNKRHRLTILRQNMKHKGQNPKAHNRDPLPYKTLPSRLGRCHILREMRSSHVVLSSPILVHCTKTSTPIVLSLFLSLLCNIFSSSGARALSVVAISKVAHSSL